MLFRQGVAALPAVSHSNRGCRLAVGGGGGLERDTSGEPSAAKHLSWTLPVTEDSSIPSPLPLLTPRPVTSDDTRDIRDDAELQAIDVWGASLWAGMQQRAHVNPDPLSECLRRYQPDPLGGPGRPAFPGAVGRFLA